jgi:hypothetical protein
LPVSAPAAKRPAGPRETFMTTLEIILIVITFVVPGICILLDDPMWKRGAR